MQAVLGLVMVAALFVGAVSVGLGFAGLRIERLALGSMGVGFTATGLLLIGEAVMPRWDRAWWKPPPGGRATVRLGRLSSLGGGVWFGTGGVVFLAGAALGGDLTGLPPAATWVLLGAAVAAAGLVAAGMRDDGRVADAARAAVRTPGWLQAARGADDGLPGDEAQRRQDARAGLGWSIQAHLTGRTTPERADARVAGEVVSAPHTAEFAGQWQGFRSAFVAGDEVWEFSTVAGRPGAARGEEGFARLRRGAVADWFITAVVG